MAADPAASEGAHTLADAANRVRTTVLSTTELDLPWDNARLLVVRGDDDLRDAVATALRTRP